MGTASRAREGFTGVVVLAITLSAFLLTFSSTAIAASVVDRGAPPPKVSKVSTASVVGETIASPASAEDYWTPERMASAKPAEVPSPADSLDVPDFGRDASSSAASGDFTPGNVTEFPQIVHGRIFFSVGSDNFTCSGTVIDSANAKVIFTAGHCVFDQTAKDFVQNFVFVPGYENGTAPYGGSPAVNLYTTGPWVNEGSNAYDIGVAVLNDPVQKTTSSRQIAFDLDPRGLDYTLFGYPSKPNPPYDGEVLRGCHSEIVGQDNMQGSIVKFPILDKNKNLVPFPIAAHPCFMQQGASGGGWITLGNYVNSVVSYGYCDNFPNTCGYVFGPYFSDAAKALYVKAGGSPAPTIKLVKAPPKVVRKRAVSFKFKGSAATLVGFVCKLDRQKKVSCASKISIKRLRPGKHTLRVWAVDQTGHLSKKKIVRRFRVVLRRR